jgi:hypothetical protein
MPNTRNRAGKDETAADETLPSSPGDNPVELVPKDVSPENAAARDLTVRPIASPDPEEREEALLDEAIEETFPASDPIAVPAYDPTREKRKPAREKAGSEPQPKSRT